MATHAQAEAERIRLHGKRIYARIALEHGDWVLHVHDARLPNERQSGQQAGWKGPLTVTQSQAQFP